MLPTFSIIGAPGLETGEETLLDTPVPTPIIGITGTRGKTTTATWTHYFLKGVWPGAVLTGNVAQVSLLAVLDDLTDKVPVVAELSSFQLELLPQAERSPHVAVVTNIMRDHLNRHATMEKYVDAKANIFKYQTKEDVFILRKDNEWTDYMLAKKPKSKVIFYDKEPLGFAAPPHFIEEWGEHNVENLKAAAHGAHALGVPWETIEARLVSLPHPPHREEVIVDGADIMVVNDTTATTPDATVAAIRTFKNKGTLILIAGGTDKELVFDKWAQVVQNELTPERVVLLEGSATSKMIDSLAEPFRDNIRSFDSLEKCIERALDVAQNKDEKTVILFSPGAASFEKFTNEFDRGKQFTSLIHKRLSKGE